MGDIGSAERHFAVAHDLLPSDDSAPKAQVLIDWSLTLARGQQIAAVATLAQRGLAAAQSAGDAAALARRSTLLALLARPSGDLASALAAGEAALAAAHN